MKVSAIGSFHWFTECLSLQVCAKATVLGRKLIKHISVRLWDTGKEELLLLMIGGNTISVNTPYRSGTDSFLHRQGTCNEQHGGVVHAVHSVVRAWPVRCSSVLCLSNTFIFAITLSDHYTPSIVGFMSFLLIEMTVLDSTWTLSKVNKKKYSIHSSLAF